MSPPWKLSSSRRVEAAVRDAEGALVLFATAGFPHPEATPAVLEALDAGGADVIELGLPFSDSLADGPTVQSSYHRAIEAGMNLPRALEQLREVSGSLRAPVVLMGSLNPILAMGTARFLQTAAEAGASGILVPDLLPADAGDLRRTARECGLEVVPLAAPSTPLERYPHLLRGAGGFLYQITRAGTTGARAGALPPGLGERVAAVRGRCRLPICLGFGISTRAQVREAQRLADGAVVGSALLRRLEPTGTPQAAARAAREAAEELSGRAGEPEDEREARA